MKYIVHLINDQGCEENGYKGDNFLAAKRNAKNYAAIGWTSTVFKKASLNEDDYASFAVAAYRPYAKKSDLCLV